MMTRGSFQAFDWKNKAENIRHYNCEHPPTYQLSSISTPVVLIWSNNDNLATVKDKTKLERELSNIISIHQVDCLHLDYLWGEGVHTGLYGRIVQMLGNRSK